MNGEKLRVIRNKMYSPEILILGCSVLFFAVFGTSRSQAQALSHSLKNTPSPEKLAALVPVVATAVLPHWRGSVASGQHTRSAAGVQM